MDMVVLVTLVDLDLILGLEVRLVQDQMDLVEQLVPLVSVMEIRLVVTAVEILWEQRVLEAAILQVMAVAALQDKVLVLEVDQMVLVAEMHLVITKNNKLVIIYTI